jgi:prephenate dehydrogenase
MTTLTDASDPSVQPFPTSIVLAGLGTMGRSVAHLIRRRSPTCRILGVDADAGIATRALLEGWVDGIETSLEGIPSGVEAIVLAVPSSAIPVLVGGLGGRVQPGVFITDTLYLNAPVLNLAQRAGLGDKWISASPTLVLPPSALTDDVPEDLLVGVEVRLSAQEELDPELKVRAEAFWRALGGDVYWMEAVAQDQLAAWSVALPQLVSNALAGALHAAGVPRSALPPQFQGLVTPAEMPADRWLSLLDASAPATGTGLTSVSRALQVVADLLARRHVDRIGEFMDRTRGWAEGTPQAPEARGGSQ